MKTDLEIWVDETDRSARIFNNRAGAWLSDFFFGPVFKQDAVTKCVKAFKGYSFSYKIVGKD